MSESPFIIEDDNYEIIPDKDITTSLLAAIKASLVFIKMHEKRWVESPVKVNVAAMQGIICRSFRLKREQPTEEMIADAAAKIFGKKFPKEDQEPFLQLFHEAYKIVEEELS